MFAALEHTCVNCLKEKKRISEKIPTWKKEKKRVEVMTTSMEQDLGAPGQASAR
jgi:hypothetical protein